METLDEDPMEEYFGMLYEGGIDAVGAEVHAVAVEKGFWDAPTDVNFVLSKLALIHSEVSETLEAIRKDMGEEVVLEELADIVIRIVDLFAGMKDSGMLGPTASLDEALFNKIEKNRDRPRMHGVLA